MQDQRPALSMSRKLPREIVLLVMVHTASGDLVNLIQTEKFMNDLFKHHKIRIFKRMQICQFPEFLGWFGDLPGFDGPTLGDNRTAEQVQFLRDVVFTIDWRPAFAAPSAIKAAEMLLRFVERHGGWWYLWFLSALRCYVNQAAYTLCRLSLPTTCYMDEGLAKAMVLCLSRISWNAAAAVGGEWEGLASATRVQSRLKSFHQEPPSVQRMMVSTLKLLLCHAANRLKLTDTELRFRWFYRSWVGFPVTVQEEEYFNNLASEVITRFLLGCFFTYGIITVLQVCEELCEQPFSNHLEANLIRFCFERNLMNHLDAAIQGSVLFVDPYIQEGSLWAAGMGLSTRGWFHRAGKV